MVANGIGDAQGGPSPIEAEGPAGYLLRRHHWKLGWLVASYAGLALLHDLDRHPVLFYLLLGSAFAALWMYAQRTVHAANWQTLLAIAVLVRCLLLTLPPSLSDDIYRYVWDGRVVASGFDPYQTTPDSAELAPMRDALWDLTAHRDVPSVYPPLAQVGFVLAAATSHPVLAFKLLVLLCDLATCVLLYRCANRFAVPTVHCAWYAWNPLVVLEGAGMGHVDFLGVPFVVAAILLLGGAAATRRAARAAIAGFAVAAGTLVKLVPIVALGAWLAWAGAPRRAVLFAGSLSVGLLVGFLPLALGVGFPPGLVRYGVSWEFNGLLFEPLWRVLEQFQAVDLAREGVRWLERRFDLYDELRNAHSYLYPQFLAKLMLAAAALGGLVWAFTRRSPLRAVHLSLLVVLLCSATIYPWYLAWVLPSAALLRHRPVLILCASIQFAYLPRLFEIHYMPIVYLVVWLPFLVAVAWELSPKRVRRGVDTDSAH